MTVLGETFKRALLPLMTPVIIIGGIWSGIFTPTEPRPWRRSIRSSWPCSSTRR